MGNIRWIWLLSVAFLFSCASFKEWDSYAKYQEEKGFNREKYEEKVRKELKTKKEKKEKKESLYEKEVKEKVVRLLAKPPTPVKVPDTILRVLILPYVGSDGSLNTMKYVFFKVEEGKWVIGNYLIERKGGVKVFTPLKEEENEGK